MTNKIKIGSKLIGDGRPCFVIAEAGVNHNGSLNRAKRMIDIARAAGADAVKFQTFTSSELVTDNAPVTQYQKINTGKTQSQLEMLKTLELNFDDFKKLKKYADKKKIIFLSTPHSDDVINALNPLVPAFKIGSGDLTNLPFLEKIAKKKKPIILSTGMATLDEVREAVKTIKKQGNNKIILLHCTTNYPCPLKETNLKAMLTLKKEFNLLVGYSDHTLGIIIPIMAATLGATVLEKHFTLDKKLEGPDHKASLEPNELKKMVKTIRMIGKAFGSGIKKPTKSEEKIKKFVRKSIVAKIDIPKGTKITKKMLAIKRPGTGIQPKHFYKIVGEKINKNIEKDKIITFKILR